tara:strand:+ start:274 stop:672 length:399 start_codon:yes stop_codon:yes gene_type:complete
MELNQLIPLGTKIKIDKSNLENVLTEKSLSMLPQTINGEVIDYKMTDGMGIGYVLMTENKLKVWVFNNELDDQTKMEYKIECTNDSKARIVNGISLGRFKINYKLNSNRDIKTTANPINLFSWLVFTLKDIF